SKLEGTLSFWTKTTKSDTRVTYGWKRNAEMSMVSKTLATKAGKSGADLGCMVPYSAIQIDELSSKFILTIAFRTYLSSSVTAYLLQPSDFCGIDSSASENGSRIKARDIVHSASN